MMTISLFVYSHTLLMAAMCLCTSENCFSGSAHAKRSVHRLTAGEDITASENFWLGTFAAMEDVNAYYL